MSDRGTNLVRMGAVVMILSAATVLAQQSGQRGRNAPPSPPHDPHDLSGIWLGRAITSGFDDPAPTYTAAGKAAVDANKPSFGPRAVLPALGNDPLGDANPPGTPRALINHSHKNSIHSTSGQGAATDPVESGVARDLD